MILQDSLGASIDQVATSFANFLQDSEKVERLKEMVANFGNVLVGVAESLSSFFNSIPADSDPITHMFDRIGASIANTMRKIATFSVLLGAVLTLTGAGAGLGISMMAGGVGLSMMADEIDKPKARDGAEVVVHDGEVILNPVQQSGIMNSNKEVVAVLNKMNKINPVQQPMAMDSNGNKEIVAGLNRINERLAVGIPMSATIKGGHINIATDEGYVGGGPEYSNIVVKG